MYEWITHTHNDISGKCPYQCRYCYMLKQRWKHDPTLRLNDKALKANLGKDNTIFIGSSLDFCHPEIQTEWILKTLDHCNKYIENNLYILQTKNPGRFLEQDILNHPLMQNKEQVILCTTIETNRLRDILLVARRTIVDIGYAVADDVVESYIPRYGEVVV